MLQTLSQRAIRFVDLGRYLCEVRAEQYWRLDNLESFDEFLERKFPESRPRHGYGTRAGSRGAHGERKLPLIGIDCLMCRHAELRPLASHGMP